ncbi:MAG: hypothetical protein J6I79_02320 [Paludibacteraceae bacterium]|nr:hypothetical protein [Paludibacteraceae bacterium]
MASSADTTYRTGAGNSLPPVYGNRNIIQTHSNPNNMRQMAMTTAMMMALMPLRIVDWLMNLVWNLMAAVIETVLSIILSWVAIILTILLLTGTFLWMVSL